MKKSGSLTVVGTGIQTGQLTLAARNAIEEADKVLYFVTGPTAKSDLQSLNPTAESLAQYYVDGKERFVTYMEMVGRILGEVKRGLHVCAAFYGHPGVFVIPAHEAIRQAREAGIPAKMLPGISAEDCLFADLGIDPALPGCQSFEATDFLIHRRQFDVTASLILWQIGAIGVQTCEIKDYAPRNLDVLAEYLSGFYGPNHRAVIYEASLYPDSEWRAEVTALSALPDARVSRSSTLYVAPKDIPRPMDTEMVRRLGMDEEAVDSLEAKLHMKLRSIHTVTTARQPRSG
ncbi:MAG TPA: SAM-dependent methyltransferase [Thermoanaerobaculia bacterium]|nr:SAM-dependent methyltransferase [Thermoanaerobaculia bacterium]